MTQRGTVSRKPAKAQQRKPTRPKLSNAAMAARHAKSALSELQKQLKSQVRELEEARAFARPIRQGLSVLKAMFCNLLAVKAEKASERSQVRSSRAGG